MTPLKSARLSVLRRAYDLATAVAGVPAWVRSLSRIIDHEHAFRVEEGRDWWTRGGDTRVEKTLEYAESGHPFPQPEPRGRCRSRNADASALTTSRPAEAPKSGRSISSEARHVQAQRYSPESGSRVEVEAAAIPFLQGTVADLLVLRRLFDAADRNRRPRGATLSRWSGRPGQLCARVPDLQLSEGQRSVRALRTAYAPRIQTMGERMISRLKRLALVESLLAWTTEAT